MKLHRLKAVWHRKKIREILDKAADCENDEAYELYLKAVKYGSVEAMYRIYVLFAEKGFRAKEDYSRLTQGLPVMPWNVKTVKTPDCENGLYWLRNAADCGHSMACNLYGRMLLEAGHTDKGLLYLKRSADGDAWISYFSKHGSFSDKEYRTILSGLVTPAMDIDIEKAGMLKEGKPEQLALYGHVLTNLYNRGKISASALNYFMPKADGIPYFPVAPKRGCWKTFVRVNKDALPDGTLLTFATDINNEPESLHGLRFAGTAVYKSPAFGWLEEVKTATVMQVDSSVHLDESAIADVARRYRLREDEYKPENIAFFEEDGEKEYSVEIARIDKGTVEVLYRYSIDGSDSVYKYFTPELVEFKQTE